MAKRAPQAVRWAFIEDWLKNNYATDVLDSPFHDAYAKAFPQYAREWHAWGACPVKQAMKDLKTMYDSNVLQRQRLDLGLSWQPGFPRWVWSYQLKA